MIKTKKVVKTEEVDEVEDIICNKCGNTLKDDCRINFEGIKLRTSWGYASKKDGETHESHLCEKCYDELIETFKYPPTITYYI